LHGLVLGVADLKLTPLYDIEMNGILEEVALLKYVSIDDLFRLADFSRTEKDN